MRLIFTAAPLQHSDNPACKYKDKSVTSVLPLSPYTQDTSYAGGGSVRKLEITDAKLNVASRGL